MAYNSLLESKSVITTVAMLPIIKESPAAWEHLCTALKKAEKIKNRIYKDGKTIISFNLQLYIKTIMLQEKVHPKRFCFLRGRALVVFGALKYIEKFTDGSDPDQSFDEESMQS